MRKTIIFIGAILVSLLFVSSVTAVPAGQNITIESLQNRINDLNDRIEKIYEKTKNKAGLGILSFLTGIINVLIKILEVINNILEAIIGPAAQIVGLIDQIISTLEGIVQAIDDALPE